jgi:hypothetical protein
MWSNIFIGIRTRPLHTRMLKIMYELPQKWNVYEIFAYEEFYEEYKHPQKFMGI